MNIRLTAAAFVAWSALGFAQTAAADPAAVTPGRLVICGGGALPLGGRTRFFDLAGGAKARIVVIPTASRRAADAPDEDFVGGWRALEPESVEVVHVADGNRADLVTAAHAIDAATGVWLSGGSQSRLTEAYLGTAVAESLAKLLARGGVVGGTSAGAACMSKVMIAGGRPPKARVAEGFGFLEGVVVDQHFSERNRLERLRGVIADRPALVGIGVDERTALEVRGRSATVIGQNHVTVLLAAGAGRNVRVISLRAGNTIDLPQLQRAAGERAAPSEFAEFAVPKGTLVLGGGGALPGAALARLVALAGGQTAKLLVITTACGRPAAQGAEAVERLRKFKPASITTLDAKSRSQAESEAFSQEIAAADAVWFIGDRPWQIVDRYAGTRAHRALHAVLERGGIVGGTSSAISTLSSVLLRGHPLDDGILLAEGYEHGLALLPGFAIEPHCAERGLEETLSGAVSAERALYALGIDERTVAIVSGSSLEVIGAGKARLRRWSAGRDEPPRAVLEAGQSFDFISWETR